MIDRYTEYCLCKKPECNLFLFFLAMKLCKRSLYNKEDVKESGDEECKKTKDSMWNQKFLLLLQCYT